MKKLVVTAQQLKPGDLVMDISRVVERVATYGADDIEPYTLVTWDAGEPSGLDPSQQLTVIREVV